MSKKARNLFALCIAFAMLITTLVYKSTASAATVLGGDNRYDTALKIVQEGWITSDSVIIARGDDLSDALASAPLAYVKDKAPILLTKTDAIPDGVLDELVRLGATKVTIVGGTGAVSEAVEAELKATGVTVERLSGANRFATSLAIAKEAFKTAPTHVVIANGLASADALSISAIAANKGMPILLVNNKTGLSVEQKAYIAGSTVYAVGGTAVLSEAIVESATTILSEEVPATATRLSGDNRYETNAAILAEFTPDYSKVFLAKGTNANLVDALVGSAFAALDGNPIVLVNANSTIIPSLRGILKNKLTSESTEVLLGGTVSQSAVDVFEDLKPIPLKVLSIK